MAGDAEPRTQTVGRTPPHPLARCLPGLPLGAFAAVACITAAGASWLSLAAASCVLCASVWTARRDQRRSLAQVQMRGEQAAASSARVRSFAAAALPIWARQLETVRSAGDGEVDRIARAASGFLARLEDAAGEAPAGGSRKFASDLARTGRQVDALVAALRQSQDSKQRMVQDIRGEADRLQETAGEIRRIAMHTRVVTLNATVEAARAGAAGRPFATIVADMRDLVQRTAQTSDDFSRAIERLYDMVKAAFDADARGPGAAALQQTEELVQDVLMNFRALGERLDAAQNEVKRERDVLRAQIFGVVEALQFQDRASQVLSHVVASLGSLEKRLSDDDAQLDTRAWLRDMAASYSTPEEHASHAAQPRVAERRGEITYF